MTRWFNPSHPQTLQAAVILGYFSAVFGLLNSGSALFLMLFIAVGVGAFGSANNKRWGYVLLTVAAVAIALFWLVVFVTSIGQPIEFTLLRLNGTIFPTALAVAVLHPHTREYQKVWFE
ncbi:MAG: hypothetical protein ACFCVK_10545 [Acidimicrobiales bacterium]